MSGSPEQEPPKTGTLLSDADRDRLAEALGEHAAAGRISVSELEARVATVLGAEFREEAAATVADLPPLDPLPERRRRRRGHAETDAPGAGWTPTSERFRDPGSGRIMRVWIDPLTRRRHYVAEDGP